MVIVWRLRGNIIRTAPCFVVWHSVHSQQHTHVSSSYRSSRLGLSHWDPYAMHRGGCLELYYCNMVEWYWWDSSLIWKTNWLPSVLWHCWFGHMTCKIVPRMSYNVFGGMLNLAQSYVSFITRSQNITRPCLYTKRFKIKCAWILYYWWCDESIRSLTTVFSFCYFCVQCRSWS